MEKKVKRIVSPTDDFKVLKGPIMAWLTKYDPNGRGMVPNGFIF